MAQNITEQPLLVALFLFRLETLLEQRDDLDGKAARVTCLWLHSPQHLRRLIRRIAEFDVVSNSLIPRHKIALITYAAVVRDGVPRRGAWPRFNCRGFTEGMKILEAPRPGDSPPNPFGVRLYILGGVHPSPGFQAKRFDASQPLRMRLNGGLHSRHCQADLLQDSHNQLNVPRLLLPLHGHDSSSDRCDCPEVRLQLRDPRRTLESRPATKAARALL